MMNEILIRFKLIKDNRVLDVFVDERLNFKANYKLLSNIVEIDRFDYKVYDPNKKIFLDNEVPIEEFNINSYLLLYLF